MRRLVQRRSVRQAEGAFVVEGSKLLAEALDAGAAVEGVYAGPGADDALLERAATMGIRVHALAPGVVERIADAVTPQPELAVVAMAAPALEHLRHATFVVVCVDVRDPGNLGTVLRSAEAAGADGVVCCAGTADVHNPKTVRASAGALFHVAVVSGDTPEVVLRTLGEWGLRRVATAVTGGVDYTKVDMRVPTAIVLGNEASGLDEDVAALADEAVTIPMAGRSESLNVGMAAAVLSFELARQRRVA